MRGRRMAPDIPWPRMVRLDRSGLLFLVAQNSSAEVCTRMIYRVLYRGPLSSCNYACGYCPFAKRAETHAELEDDRRALDAFLKWIAEQRHRRFGILFTPWGEALV